MWAWKNPFLWREDDLVRLLGESLRQVHKDVCEKVLSDIDHMHSDTFLYVEDSMFVHRTRGELGYLEALRVIRNERLQSLFGVAIITPVEWVWQRLQLGIEFRYLRKNGPYWKVYSGDESRLRTQHWWYIPYRCLSTFGLR